jgi:hypothetical protein
MVKLTLKRIGWIGASVGLTTALVGCNDMKADGATAATGAAPSVGENIVTTNGLN